MAKVFTQEEREKIKEQVVELVRQSCLLYTSFRRWDNSTHEMKWSFNAFAFFNFFIAKMVSTFYFLSHHHDSAFTGKPSRPRKTLIMQSVIHVFVVRLRI